MFTYLLDFNAFSVISCTSSSNNVDSVNSRTCPRKLWPSFLWRTLTKKTLIVFFPFSFFFYYGGIHFTCIYCNIIWNKAKPWSEPQNWGIIKKTASRKSHFNLDNWTGWRKVPIGVQVNKLHFFFTKSWKFFNKAKKKKCVFTVRRPTIIFGPDPKLFLWHFK